MRAFRAGRTLLATASLAALLVAAPAAVAADKPRFVCEAVAAATKAPSFGAVILPLAFRNAVFARTNERAGLAMIRGESEALGIDFSFPTDARRVAVRTGGVTTEYGLDAFFTNDSTSPKTVTDATGLPVWAPHNLVTNSESGATQNVAALVVGQDYIVDVTGSGSVALTLAGTGTATAGSPVHFTATGTTLTLTVTGTIATMQCNRGAVVLPYLKTTGAKRYGVAIEVDAVTGERYLVVETSASSYTNLLLNTNTLATQDVTVTAQSYTLSFWGTGTVTLSGTSTAGPLVGTAADRRVTLTFTPTAGTLTLTVSGSVTFAQLEVGPEATSYFPSYASAATRVADTIYVTVPFAITTTTTLCMDYRGTKNDTSGYVNFGLSNGGTSTEGLYFRADSAAQARHSSTSAGIVTDLAIVPPSAARTKIAISAGGGNLIAARDGSAAATTLTAQPAVTKLYLGYLPGIQSTTRPLRLYGCLVLSRAMTRAQAIAWTSQIYPYDDALVSDGATYPSYGQTASPSSIYVASTDTTWVAYEAYTGGQRVTRVFTINHTTGVWTDPVTVGVSGLSGDDHGAPTLMRHSDGKVHVFFGGHISALKHSMTTTADDPSAWTTLASICSTGSYPRPVMVGSIMYVLIRGNGSAAATQYLSYCTIATDGTASAFTVLSDFGTGTRWYAGAALPEESTGNIYIVGTQGQAATVPLTGTYVLVWNPGAGTIKNIDGSTTVASGSWPVGLASLDANFNIHPTIAGNEGGVPNACLDATGNLHVIFADGANGGTPGAIGSYSVYHTAWDGSAWSADFQLGTAWRSYNDVCLTPNAGGGVNAFWTQRGEATFRNWGGDLWSASRDSGGTWAASAVLREEAFFALNAPSMVVNGHANLRMICTEVLQQSADISAGIGTLRMFGYGDAGFLSAA